MISNKERNIQYIGYYKICKGVRKVIAMPWFPDENWYFSQIKRLVVDGRINDECRIEQQLKEIDALLAEVVSKDDFPSRKGANSLLECIVLATYDELEKIYKRIEPISNSIFYDIQSDLNEPSKIKTKDKWMSICKIYDKLVNNGINTKIIHKYGIRCCPYCNENYIFNREIENGKSYAMAQLDHFFPKDRFPIFAVSLYNLVPSCSSCNHIKSNKKIGISPHNHSHNFSQMQISYIPKSANWINDAEEIEIRFKYSTDDVGFIDMMNQNLDIMGIRKAYDMHKDYIQEILKKAQIYEKKHRENLMSDFPGLFSSEEDLLQTLFGNYIREDDLLKRPLSKMTMDLLKELLII